MISLHETCRQYVARRLSEGWRISSRNGFNVILQSPEGIIRTVDLRNDVLTLRPNAAGSETSISEQEPDSGEHWDKVDEVSADGDSTKVQTLSSSYERDLYNIPDHTTEAGTINFIKVYYCCAKYGAALGYAKPSLKSNATVTDGTEVSLTTYTLYSQQWNTNPATGQPWGRYWSVIDALQIGIALRGEEGVTVACCTQVYVEVDYTPRIPRYGFVTFQDPGIV